MSWSFPFVLAGSDENGLCIEKWRLNAPDRPLFWMNRGVGLEMGAAQAPSSGDERRADDAGNDVRELDGAACRRHPARRA